MIQFTNNAVSAVSNAITSSSTSLTIISEHSNLFPILSNPQDYFFCTLQNEAGRIEIVKVTATAGNIFTVLRGQEGTTSYSWPAGTSIELRLTAQGLRDIRVLASPVNIGTVPAGGTAGQVFTTDSSGSIYEWQNIASASAATATTEGSIGAVKLAADNADDTIRNAAATPAMVAYKINSKQRPISDSVTSGDSTVSASSKAVNTVHTSKVSKAGDTMTGSLYVGADGTNRSSIYPASISGATIAAESLVLSPTSHYSDIAFRVTRQDGTLNDRRVIIRANSEKSSAAPGVLDDTSLTINARGGLYVGAGESANVMRDIMVTGTRELPEGWRALEGIAGTMYDSSEYAFIGSDNSLYFVTGATDPTVSRMIKIFPSGNMVPGLPTQSLGIAANPWSAVLNNVNVLGSTTGNTQFPGSTRINYTVTTTGQQFTAPNDGWYTVKGKEAVSVGQYVTLTLQPNGIAFTSAAPTIGASTVTSVPISKGSIVRVTFNTPISEFFFTPAKSA